MQYLYEVHSSEIGWVVHEEDWDHILTNFVFQILQYDMWDKTPTDLLDWNALKEKIAK